MAAQITHRRTWSLTALVVPAVAMLLAAVPVASARQVPAAQAGAQQLARPGSAPGWHLVKTFASKGLNLHDIATLPGGKAWISGGRGATVFTPVFYHRVGDRWVRMPRPGIGSGSVFGADISASTDANVWGALANGSAVDHWNGNAWTRFSFSATLDTGIDGVLAFGTNHAKVFTFDFTTKQPAVHTYDGTHWTTKMLPADVDADGDVNMVTASFSSNIWTWAIDPGLLRWESMHFNGKAWTVVPIPAALIPGSAGPAQIVALSPSDVWGTVTANDTSGPIILLRWNGTAWRKVAGTPPPGELLGPIAPDGQGGAWVYAARAASKPPFMKPFFLHYAKGKWTSFAAPTSTLGPISISALELIPGTRSIWAVGGILSGQTLLGGVIEQFRP